MSPRTLAAVALVAALSVTAAHAQSTRGWALGLQSFGPYRYGATLAEAEAASGSRLRLTGRGSYTGECRNVDVDGGGATLLFTWDGRWVLRSAFVPSLDDYYADRAVTRRGHALTRSGIGLGASEADVRRTYPDRIRRETVSANEDSEEWLVYTSPDAPDAPDRGLAVVFKLGRGGVVAMAGGQRNWLSAYDACM